MQLFIYSTSNHRGLTHCPSDSVSSPEDTMLDKPKYSYLLSNFFYHRQKHKGMCYDLSYDLKGHWINKCNSLWRFVSDRVKDKNHSMNWNENKRYENIINMQYVLIKATPIHFHSFSYLPIQFSFNYMRSYLKCKMFHMFFCIQWSTRVRGSHFSRSSTKNKHVVHEKIFTGKLVVWSGQDWGDEGKIRPEIAFDIG